MPRLICRFGLADIRFSKAGFDRKSCPPSLFIDAARTTFWTMDASGLSDVGVHGGKRRKSGSPAGLRAQQMARGAACTEHYYWGGQPPGVAAR